MHLIVGLGNPGSKYTMTRHNVGFMVIDAIAHAFGAPSFKKEHKAETCKIQIPHGGRIYPVLLVKPQTFMNHSGESVQVIANYYNIKNEKILVAHDELDQPFGHLKYQYSRGHGGHNGIRNIHQMLGTKDYARLRIGIDRPSGKQDVASYVLKPFSKEEQKDLPDFLDLLIDSVLLYLEKGWQSTANEFNNKTV